MRNIGAARFIVTAIISASKKLAVTKANWESLLLLGMSVVVMVSGTRQAFFLPSVSFFIQHALFKGRRRQAGVSVVIDKPKSAKWPSLSGRRDNKQSGYGQNNVIIMAMVG